MNSLIPNDKKYLCCCNTVHVEHGALAIAMVGISFSASSVVTGIVMGEWRYVLSGIVGFLSYVSIVYAQMKKDPFFYLPFLILNGISIVVVGIYIFVLVVMLFAFPNTSVPVGALIVLFAIAECLDVWFQSVVHRAYKYMMMTQYSLGAQMHV